MEEKKLTRRQWLERGSVLGLVVLGGPSVLSACGGGELDCSNPQGLTGDQRTQRQALSYVDHAPNPTQRCEVCNFYTASQPNQCGSCSLNLGPVNPAGYCASFAARS